MSGESNGTTAVLEQPATGTAKRLNRVAFADMAKMADWLAANRKAIDGKMSRRAAHERFASQTSLKVGGDAFKRYMKLAGVRFVHAGLGKDFRALASSRSVGILAAAIQRLRADLNLPADESLAELVQDSAKA